VGDDAAKGRQVSDRRGGAWQCGLVGLGVEVPKAGASRVSWWSTRWKRSARSACIMKAHLVDGGVFGGRASMLNRSAETWLVFRHR
jgi:hypothetical protein